jgi:hypothetical protein
MAQAATVKEYNFYVKGLITEASPLTFPENASLEEDNFELFRDGSRRRRLGLDYEQDFQITSTGLSAGTISTQTIKSGLWNNVSNDPLVSILVVQVGSTFKFFDAFADNISGSALNGGRAIELAGLSTNPFQGVSIFGELVLVNGQRGFFVLKYDKETDTVTVDSRLILVRDIWGIEDGLATNQRPSGLSSSHEYNLLNQGWGSDNRDSSKSYYSSFKSSTGEYPSNSDIVWTGKNQPEDNEFAASLIERYFSGSTPTAKGAVVIDAFRRGASRVAAFNQKAFTHISTDISGDPFSIEKFLYKVREDTSTLDSEGKLISLTSIPFFQPLVNRSPKLPQDITVGGIKAVATFAGRVWFSGSTSVLIDDDRRSPHLGGFVFFSQIVDNDRKLGLCHQQGDPTSEEVPDVLDSDGGTVQIPDASTIIKLIPISNGVVAFAENGVWEVTGGDTPFSATNFQVRKVSSSGAVSPDSVLSVESNIFYWSKSGILVLAPDQVSGFLTATNLTEVTIQTLYNDISDGGKSASRGLYDAAARRIIWLYNDDPEIDGVHFVNKYNRSLTFDTVLEAFHTETFGSIPGNTPYIADIFEAPDYNVLTIHTDIVALSRFLIDSLDNEIVISEDVKGNGSSKTEYLAMKTSDPTYGFTVALQRDPDFLDWFSEDGIGVDAKAHMLTGYEILEDTQRNKQATYITCNFERTETGFEMVDGFLEPQNGSSCIVQAQWDYANSPNSGKFGPPFQAYRLKRNYVSAGPVDSFDYGQAVITSKSKIRGRGKALSLLFQTEPKRDLHLYGWGINFTGVTNV